MAKLLSPHDRVFKNKLQPLDLKGLLDKTLTELSEKVNKLNTQLTMNPDDDYELQTRDQYKNAKLKNNNE